MPRSKLAFFIQRIETDQTGTMLPAKPESPGHGPSTRRAGRETGAGSVLAGDQASKSMVVMPDGSESAVASVGAGLVLEVAPAPDE